MELQVGASAEATIDDRVLEHDAAGAPRKQWLASHVIPDETGCPACRNYRRRKHPDRRGLAGAVGTEQPEHLTGGDLEVDAPDRLDAARVSLAQLRDRDGGVLRTPAGNRCALTAGAVVVGVCRGGGRG